MKRRSRNAQDALAPLLARASPEERASISIALERFYELAVDAGAETLKPQHLGAFGEPRAERRRQAR